MFPLFHLFFRFVNRSIIIINYCCKFSGKENGKFYLIEKKKKNDKQLYDLRTILGY